MSAIRELIAELELQDRLQEEKDKEDSAEHFKKYEDMKKRIDHVKDESTKHKNSIIKGLNQLVANRHTIEDALKMEDTFTGLPIPHEHQKTTIDLVSKAAEFIKNSDVLRDTNSLSPEKIHQDLINNVESVASDLKECHTEVAQALQLYDNVLLLKQSRVTQ